MIKQGLRSLYHNYFEKLWFLKPELLDVIGAYEFVLVEPFGAEIVDASSLNSKTINWVIPSPSAGSGGHINIFRLIGHLEQQGFICRVAIAGVSQFTSSEEAHQFICRQFNPIKAEVFISAESMPPAWFTVATSWVSAYTVRNFRSTMKKCYFIQDFEPFFYPQGSEFALAEETYRFGFHGITAGQWLADKLRQDYGMKTDAIAFSYDRHLYRPCPRRHPDQKQVFFYARETTPRRGFELGILTLAAVARELPQVQFVLAGCDTSRYAIPFEHRNPGVLQLKELPDLYSQCDAALVLSFTNLSLLPVELMACGCPVVSNRGANVEWLLSSDYAVLTEPTVNSLRDGIVNLLKDDAYRHHLIQAGLAFADTTNWESESRKVATLFQRLCDEF